MTYRRRSLKTPMFGRQMLAMMALLVASWLTAGASVSAQGFGGMVIGALTCDSANSCRSEIGAHFTVTTEDGTYLGSCTVEGDPNDQSHVAACVVDFLFEPTGTVIVTEDVHTITPGYVPEENPLIIDTAQIGRASHDAVFYNLPVGGSASTGQTSDVYIVTTENGQPVYDACYVLVDFSDIGCDDNGDGQVAFADVPLGTYTVHQTADLGPSRYVDDLTINVTGGNGPYPGLDWFSAEVRDTGSSAGSNSSAPSGSGRTAQEIANGGLWQLGIAAHVREGSSTELLLGARFTVTSEAGEYIGECTLTPIDRDVGWLNCKVDVPSDRISLVWLDLSSVPAGYVPVENPISFDPTTYIAGPHNIGASFVNAPNSGSTPGGEASSTGARDIALITRDPDDGHLLFDGCYILLEYGNEGCDENGDGQITYSDVPFGVYTVHQTRTPSGYPTVSDFQIRVTDHFQQVPLGFVVRQATEQNAPGTRNVSVVFVDSRTHTKVQSSICVELSGGSETACDDALVDGQIDFLDVPAGTYPIMFTGLPAGWQIPNIPAVTIDASASSPSNQFVYVEVLMPDSAAAGSTGSSGISSPINSEAATLLMTFRGCPEGFDPAIQDFFANCTIPLDAPDASFIFWGAEGQGGMNIAWLDRQYNGAYIYNAFPLTMNVELSGLAPVLRDAYQVIGADSVSGHTYSIHLVDGEVREVFVFYYFE